MPSSLLVLGNMPPPPAARAPISDPKLETSLVLNRIEGKPSWGTQARYRRPNRVGGKECLRSAR